MPVSAIRGQLASGIDLIVHLGRLRDRSRRLLEIAEVIGLEDGQIRLSTLYQFEETGEQGNERIEGAWRRRAVLQHQGKLEAAGLPVER